MTDVHISGTHNSVSRNEGCNGGTIVVIRPTRSDETWPQYAVEDRSIAP
jgi:hypothetical protein